jgi:beta-lactamase superfamily II metal-dependent hydrolase
MKSMPGPGVAVLQSPHHGGAGANGPAFLGWAAPWLTVAQEDSRRARQAPRDRTWSTSVEGAITIRPDGPRLRARGHVTGRRADGPPAAPP